MTSLRLSINNVRRSFRDFTIYFLTLTLGVSIFYVFNSIESQQAIMSVTSGQAAALKTLNAVMANFSLFIAIILGFLIIYANRYLIKRRKQEFGIYMTLGMERSRISWILVLETIIVGLVALVVGSLLGVFLSQGMALLTAKLLGAGIASFQFVFALDALLKSILYFGLTFLLVIVFNLIMVRRQKLIDLIHAARQNERFQPPRLAASVVIFLIAVVCLGASYFIVLSRGIIDLPYLWTAIILGTLGTFLFFFSLSGFFLRLLQQIKPIYLRGLNMFVLRQINSKINTTYISITLVCLMLFASIATLSSGMGLARAVTDDLMRSLPYDATLSSSPIYDLTTGTYRPYPAQGIDLLASVRQRGAELDRFAGSYQTMRYYRGGEDAWQLQNPAGASLRSELYYAKLSDYNRILALQSAAPIALGESEYAIDSTTANTEWMQIASPQITNRTLDVGGARLHTNSDQVFWHSLEVTDSPDLNLVIVVPDHLLENAAPRRDLLHVQYHQGDPRSEALAVQSLGGLDNANLHINFDTKTGIIERSSSNTTTVTYLAVYLGIIFLLTSATVLAIIQLSEASDNAKRYKLLHQIGTEQRMINRAIFSQTLIYFGVPLMLALVHALVGISVVAKLIQSFRDSDIMASSLIAALVILIIYGGYFLATYLGSKSTIQREYSQRDQVA